MLGGAKVAASTNDDSAEHLTINRRRLVLYVDLRWLTAKTLGNCKSDSLCFGGKSLALWHMGVEDRHKDGQIRTLDLRLILRVRFTGEIVELHPRACRLAAECPTQGIGEATS